VSTTYNLAYLACTTCKEAIWIGQSNVYTPFYLYTGDKLVIEKLQEFLMKHRSRSLYNNPNDPLTEDHHTLAFIDDQSDLDGYTI